MCWAMSMLPVKFASSLGCASLMYTVTKSARLENLAVILPNWPSLAMNGGQEQEPKLRTSGRPLLAVLRRETVFPVARSYTGGLGAASPFSASLVAFSRPCSSCFWQLHFSHLSFRFYNLSLLTLTEAKEKRNSMSSTLLIFSANPHFPVVLSFFLRIFNVKSGAKILNVFITRKNAKETGKRRKTRRIWRHLDIVQSMS